MQFCASCSFYQLVSVNKESLKCFNCDLCCDEVQENQAVKMGCLFHCLLFNLVLSAFSWVNTDKEREIPGIF